MHWVSLYLFNLVANFDCLWAVATKDDLLSESIGCSKLAIVRFCEILVHYDEGSCANVL